MLAPLLSVRTLLLAIFMIMVGSGFLSTLIAIRLEQDGASALTIGLAATAYFGGQTIGSLQAPKLIARIGHIRAFSVFVSLFSASSLAYAIVTNAALWTMLRFIDGFVMSGVFVCLESWLNRQASPTTRSTILASYMIVLYGGQAGGQFLLNLNDIAPSLPFMLSAILLSLAVLPVALTRMEQPAVEKLAPFSPRRLYSASPLGIVGTIATGGMLGAFYALGAVYVSRTGMGLSQVALFTSIVIAGGVALQWPLGMLSDRLDRRKVILGCFAMVVALCAALYAVAGLAFATIALGALFGGFTFALYPLCVAHSNDHLEEDERVGASGGLVLAYSVGALVGPMLGSAGMLLLGPGGLFAMIGAIAFGAFLFGLWRLAQSAPVPEADQQSFSALPRTTPMVAVLEEEES
ncbi:MAG: MFS transporter [Sphingomonadaceae bacterium]|nr:MFS transporter [Sphingomonadaceae bacterium]